MNHDVYSIQIHPGFARLCGVFRLESPQAYDAVLAPLTEGMMTHDDYTVDLREVTLMNSSGIRALADLVLSARKAERRLRLCAKASVPWQAKTMASLQPLYPALKVELS